MQYRTRDGDMLDWICWRHYGRQAGAVEAGAVEAVLEVNPGLSDAGPILPAGLVIALPELPQPGQTVDTVRLWD